MAPEHPLILIAAPAVVIRLLGKALSQDASVAGGETWDQVVDHLLQDEAPDLIVVCYAFDEMRPFRIIAYVRYDWGRKSIPTVLVRALPVPLGATQEAEIRESYKTLGVAEFINFRGQADEYGEEVALRRFRESVLNLLPYGRDE